MKMSGKRWAVIGVVLLIGAIVALYIPYNNNIKEQETLQQQITTARQLVLVRTMSKNSLEQKILELEADIAAAEEETVQLQEELDNLQAELLQLEAEREQAIQEAIALLNATEAKFLGSAESIEYGELLFALANSADITLSQIDYSSGGTVSIEDVEYGVVFLELSVSGKKADILDYLVKIQFDDAFNTALFDQISLSLPKILTEEEKEQVFFTILHEMEAQGIADFTLDEICNFIILGIADVTGNYISTETVEDMAKRIKQILADLMEEEYEEPLEHTLTEDYDDRLALELAQLIKQHIIDLLQDTVVNEITARIVTALENGDNLESIVGEDIAALLSSELSGALPGDIAALLKTYISECIYDRMVEHVTPHVFQSAQVAANELIIQLEAASSGGIKIAVFTYNTSQEEE
ncbi:MAG: hypothetical protein PHF74_02455 [Dehalococcoidales bacterium]|nr:hypothetical protein [Dehalococcoidales bacterium]